MHTVLQPLESYLHPTLYDDTQNTVSVMKSSTVVYTLQVFHEHTHQ